ncbi:MAG TPA: hypothetical protein VFN48_07365 [Solirubrobacteraceae bacterium]|nr:hypothetical protein [Solirubrobacteraceae bacterium]
MRGRGLESIFEDDQLLVDQPLTPAGTARVMATLATLKSLGVDRVRVLVEWRQVAPDPTGAHPPAGFDPRNPADYGGGWTTFDRLDAAAALAGIGVDFDLSGPAPDWAVTPQPAGTRPGARADAAVYEPSPSQFGAFVEAAGRRYDGHTRTAATAGHPLPRVSFWSVWNEPNQPGWLSPQTDPRSGAAVAPAQLRGLVDAFWRGLRASGHLGTGDTTLVGEFAPEGCIPSVPCAFAGLGPGYGATPPLPFLENLYCVTGADGGRLAPLSGSAATAVGCPARPDPARFVAAHPGLFSATGISEHPYAFSFAPNVPFPLASERGFVPLASLSRLTDTLDAIDAAYGVGRRMPLYLTEYGYVTNPPNPDYHVSPAQQATYLDWATYIAAMNPRVRALGQFELQDSNPALSCHCTRASPKYWQSFQEGLEYLGGAHKPAFAAYRLPIVLPAVELHHARLLPGVATEVWGMLRPAPNGSTQSAAIQWRPAGAGSFRTLASTQTHSPAGFIDTSVVIPGSGVVRLAWIAPHYGVLYSREVPVHVG